ncbi:hypothetical protein F4818DRAFT_183195 [Hypoxylon cercidicola]|nr:hypothetical protein F4818DRAFT_183195 [Hypoxylon cercidicola]
MASVIVEITRPYVQGLSTPEASITGTKHLSSYNWIEAPTATIAIPGSPPVWSPPRITQPLKKDSGLIYIAQNAARHPSSPLEPLFRALYTTNPSFDIRSIDVVSDRNNIRKLLSFINPGSSRNPLEEFTIEVEVTGKTALFSRTETKTQEFIGLHEFRGFGHEFEKAYTTEKIEGSTGHHRIISYRFGDLEMIIRHETDGYLADKSMPVLPVNEREPDDLSSTMASLSLSSSSRLPTITSPGSQLTIKKGGQVVPRESTLEIKTRVSHKPLSFQEVAAQLWVSQTPKLVRAYHDRGKFQVPVVKDVTDAIKNWEKVNQGDLNRLAALIRKIVNVVKECGGRGVVKYDPCADKLVVRKVVEGKVKMLPKDLYSKWAENDVPEKEDITAASKTVIAPRDPVETSSHIRVLVGSTEYLVDTNRVPFFRTYLSSQQQSGDHAAPVRILDDMPFFDIIQHGLRDGFRQFFRRMPAQLHDYNALCQTLKTLQIDVLAGQKLRDIMEDMRKGKTDWDPDERREIGGWKSLARDSAFRLVYALLMGEFELRDSNMAYNATLFAVSHRGIFKCRTRMMVRRAFDERFRGSEKQRKSLDGWRSANDSSLEPIEDDVTTETESTYGDSDCSPS